MAENTTSLKDKYNILQNSKGEIMIMIDSFPGGPENPRVVYDGGDTILLYRSRESAVYLRKVEEEARKPVKSVDEILIVEFDEDDDVAREYKAPLRIVKSIEALVQ
ncbi:MAG: hypothetical protein LBR70_04185 [Lactobacillaceae bacterium]|jgi:hypothetical protein|nr:hypothetical protein [Lactobacillaceae bacterium]